MLVQFYTDLGFDWDAALAVAWIPAWKSFRQAALVSDLIAAFWADDCSEHSRLLARPQVVGGTRFSINGGRKCNDLAESREGLVGGDDDGDCQRGGHSMGGGNSMVSPNLAKRWSVMVRRLLLFWVFISTNNLHHWIRSQQIGLFWSRVVDS